MKLNDFYNEVSRRADTSGTKINVAETRRVLAMGFRVLAELDGPEMADTLAKALAQAQKQTKRGT